MSEDVNELRAKILADLHQAEQSFEAAKVLVANRRDPRFALRRSARHLRQAAALVEANVAGFDDQE